MTPEEAQLVAAREAQPFPLAKLNALAVPEPLPIEPGDFIK